MSQGKEDEFKLEGESWEDLSYTSAELCPQSSNVSRSRRGLGKLFTITVLLQSSTTPLHDNSYLYQSRRNERQWKSVDEVFGTPHYFTFTAQDELPSELLKLVEKIRAAYTSSGKVGKVREQLKENLLPVIWDSGASAC